MEAMGNKMNAYYMLTNIGPDIPSGSSSLSSRNNRVIFRTRIPQMRVLTQFGKDLMENFEGSGFTSFCGGNGSYRNSIRRLSN